MQVRRLVVGFIAALGSPVLLAQDWPTFGGDPGGSQYSPLDQITRDNVAQLEQVWVHRSGDVRAGEGLRATSLQVTPLHVNNLLVYCTPMNRVFALDPATGGEVWVFDPHAEGDGGPFVDEPPAAGTCRGVSYWAAAEPTPGERCQKRIFKGDRQGNLYAIDADDGRVCRDFGAAKGHPGYVTHYDYPGYGEGYRGMSSPSVVVGDVVIAASASNDGISNANDGVVRGFHVRTGELLWEFNPIPVDKRDITGAANVWSTMSADLARDLVFLPTTSPSTDYYGVNRLFDIPLSDAVVAVRAATGEIAWSFQTVRHDLFDYDLPGHALLVTIQKDGAPREVAIQQTKMGHLFVFDRETGEPVFPIEDRPVPASDVPGEVAAATQPHAVLPEAFAGQLLERDELFGLTPWDKGWCQKTFDAHRYEGMYTPPSEQGTIFFPSALGGGNWGGAAYDPNTNLLIIKSENLATRLKFVKQVEGETLPPGDYLTRPLEGTPYRTEGEIFMSPLGIPCTPPPWGTLSAIDMDSGKIRWQIPIGQIKRFGITIPAAFGWGSPHIGGPVVTASGLIFVAGTMDEKIRALDVQTGEELWQAKLPTLASAVPMTYMAGGRQYVVIAAGGTSRVTEKLRDALVAFALPAP